MSMVDQILGRKPVREDSPPVQVARSKPVAVARRAPPEDEEESELKKRVAKIRTSSVVAGILGVSENDNEGIIPDSAKSFDSFSVTQIPGMKEAPDLDSVSPSEPNSGHEELIAPSAALVAPDVTPNVLQLIDPSQVPAPPAPATPPPQAQAPTGQPQHALDTLMGRQNTEPQPDMAAVTAESFMQAVNPGVIKNKVAEALTPEQEGGSMPIHKESDGRAIYSAFRRLVG